MDRFPTPQITQDIDKFLDKNIEVYLISFDVMKTNASNFPWHNLGPSLVLTCATYLGHLPIAVSRALAHGKYKQS